MVITYYSFKGGVGRSMALANIAEILYRRGLRVIIIDWDLEAPGVDQYFRSVAERDLENRGGLIDLLVEYKNWSAGPTNDTFELPPSVLDFLQDIYATKGQGSMD